MRLAATLVLKMVWLAYGIQFEGDYEVPEDLKLVQGLSLPELSDKALVGHSHWC
jgi:hypothetical protein